MSVVVVTLITTAPEKGKMVRSCGRECLFVSFCNSVSKQTRFVFGVLFGGTCHGFTLIQFERCMLLRIMLIAGREQVSPCSVCFPRADPLSCCVANEDLIAV